MKKLTLLSLVVLSAVVVGGKQAFAEEMQTNDPKSSQTTITIKDDDGTDEPDPKDPTQRKLFIQSVPGEYNFEGTLADKNYTLSTELTDQSIDVYNNRTGRIWSVGASLKDSEVYRVSDNKSFGITSFKMTTVIDGADKETDVTATGNKGLVAKSAQTMTESNNTGTISTQVKNISVAFTDADNALKANDKLQGTITYSLYNTIDVK